MIIHHIASSSISLLSTIFIFFYTRLVWFFLYSFRLYFIYSFRFCLPSLDILGYRFFLFPIFLFFSHETIVFINLKLRFFYHLHDDNNSALTFFIFHMFLSRHHYNEISKAILVVYLSLLSTFSPNIDIFHFTHGLTFIHIAKINYIIIFSNSNYYNIIKAHVHFSNKSEQPSDTYGWNLKFILKYSSNDKLNVLVNP